jgi:DnaA family protein
MNAQLPLSLDLRARLRLEDFVPGANDAVVAACEALLAGRHEQLYLSGPPGSGRSHLLLGVCEAAERLGLPCAYLPMAHYRQLPVSAVEGMDDLQVLAIDDVDAVAGDAAWEGALFALYNRARTRGTRLLFAAARGPGAIAIALPDLRSRLAWGVAFQVAPLDDAGRLELVQREAARRGLVLQEGVGRYLLTRCPRDPGQLLEVVAHLDREALAAQRPLTLPFVRGVLQRGD